MRICIDDRARYTADKESMYWSFAAAVGEHPNLCDSPDTRHASIDAIHSILSLGSSSEIEARMT